MLIRKFLVYFVTVITVATLLISQSGQARADAYFAAPTNPKDETKVPHYFGPYSNYANSPQTLADATVEITGDGSGATATAAVDPLTGSVSGFTITNPGSNYSYANVLVLGVGSGAAGSAVINTSGVVTAITVGDPGAGYTTPVVSITGGGAFGAPVTSASISPAAADVFNVNVGSATGGSFTLSVDAVPTTPIAFNAAAATVQSALNALAGVSTTVLGTGSIADPWVITFAVAPTTFTMDGAGLTQATTDSAVSGAAGLYNVNVGSATGGSFTLSVDAVATTPIAFNAAALDVETALNALAGVSTTVLGTGSIADPWVITFAVAPTTFTMDGAGLTQAVTDASVAAAPIKKFSVNVGSAGAGSFTLSVDGVPTTPIAFNAAAATVQSALNALAGVSTTVLGSGSIADPWVITFAVAPVSFTINGGSLSESLGTLVNATATASGGVDAVNMLTGGINYTPNATVDFDLPDDPNGVKASGSVTVVGGVITGVVVDNPGSGYLTPPGVTIIDGMTRWDVGPGEGATAVATLKITGITLDTFGSGYASTPTVEITDATGSGTGATATATTDVGAITAIVLDAPGSGYLTPGLKKFVDPLPGLCDPSTGCPVSGKYIPLGVADKVSYSNSDTYEIGLVQYRMAFSSQMPPALVRGYVQLETPANASISQHFPLVNEMLDGSSVPVLVNGVQAYGVTPPQYLGPTILATRDRAVRIIFRNLLPTGVAGNLFLPVDSTIMGSGMDPTMGGTVPVDNGTVLDEVRNPICGEIDPMTGAKPMGCFSENRATLHLHGGVTPWISDGTPHQWITPAGEDTTYPEGVSVQNVPDMDLCGANNDGCQTFYYTNQQSARLMFYHDHAWGITRLNVYAGEAAGYLITDPTEQKLMAPGGALAGLGYGLPLIIQDKTFVSANIATQDPTWDASRWGGEGNLWAPHVYMPAQNPGSPTGVSMFGRWMYGPWFWPPATNVPYQPIDNPYYDSTCDLSNPATWQYQADPFCEPEFIPGTPNISVGMEAFNDTPVVNGTAYPTITLDPKAYRLRILNAANDRFWNLQWYVGDPTTANADTGATEVALKAAEVAAAQTDPNIVPTPDTSKSPVGPSWIQIGTEGGFLPAPVVVPNQPITWITDPTRFDVGNVDKHALLLAPAERADVIVDFSRYAGKTLILYNDAPAAFPARSAGYDYYTGGPDLSPAGAPTTLPGYGPNTRTIMQVKIAATTPAPTFNLTALNNAFKHHADGSGVFESSQHPIIVGQAAYNSAYGTSFTASGWCNAPGSTSTKCDGYARVQEQGGFQLGFNTLLKPNTKTTIALQPKGMHDEMNSTSFDEYGRMQATLGLEAPGATPLLQNIILYPYVNPSTEIIDGTGLPVGDVGVKPISVGTDGTQIWKITHNGVDTHPIHFHLYDVQILNRVTWDNIILPPDATELGWKETIRVSPLEDTIIALRPIIPTLPFEVPNSVRTLNPMMPLHSTVGFNNIDQNGNPTTAITNELVNFGWEYVYHCHILSHEEMDMMRPVTLAVPPNKPDGLAWVISGTGASTKLTLSWNDNSITETSFVVQRNGGSGWVDLTTIQSPLDSPNTHGIRSYEDATYRRDSIIYSYRVVAKNLVGYGGAYMSLSVQSVSPEIAVIEKPTNLQASDGTFTDKVQLTWTASNGATSYQVFRGTTSIAADATLLGGLTGTTYNDTSASTGVLYAYWVKACSGAICSDYSTLNTGWRNLVPPANVQASDGTFTDKVQVTWDASIGATFYKVYRATTAAGAGITLLGSPTGLTFDDTIATPAVTYYYAVKACLGSFCSGYSANNTGWRNLSAPATVQASDGTFTDKVQVIWTASSGATSYQVYRATTNVPATGTNLGSPASSPYNDTTAVPGVTYYYWVKACKATVCSAFSASDTGWRNLLPPTNLLASDGTYTTHVRLTWTAASGATSYDVYRATTAGGAGITLLGSTASLAFNDTTATPAITYYYSVKACRGTPCSGFSTSDTGWRNMPAPTNVQASDGAFPDKVQVTWTAALGATSYQVYRATTAGGAGLTLLGSPTVLTFDDTTGTVSLTYYYSVKACSGAICSGYSAANTGFR
jgi:FtsP/CotA-like multicopper oxidase with cupredoxin domain